MPFRSFGISLANERIAVYESAGSGHPIVLVPGNSASGLTFSEILDGELGETNRIVTFDFAGHGGSDRAADPGSTYSMRGRTRVLESLIMSLGLENAVVIGWSLGGHTTLQAVPDLPNAAGFGIYGTPPLAVPPSLEEAFTPNPAFAAAMAEDPPEEMVEGLLKSFLAPSNQSRWEDLLKMWRDTHGLARSTLAASVIANEFDDEREIVKAMTAPLLVMHGEHDSLVRLDYIRGIETTSLWRGDIQIVLDAGHAAHLDNPSGFTRVLSEFVSDVC